MKDKIITFILTVFIIGIIAVLAVLGYFTYKEITQNGRIEISFESESIFPIIKYETLNSEHVDFDDSMFDGVNCKTQETTNTVRNKYFYDQLTNTAKTIYNKLEKNKENLKTGTYRIEFSDAFQSLLSQENGDVELKKQYQSAIEAFIYENPDVFYLDVTKMYINIEKITKITGTKYNVYINNGSEDSYLLNLFRSKEDIEEYEKQIQSAKEEILEKVKGQTDYQKIRTIHNYLIDTIEYEDSLTEDNIYDIYGALVNKRCVCEGYAKAFQYLMNEIGVENVIVIGTGTNNKNQTENHAWNYVKLNEAWYAIDVTWDDPVLGIGAILTNKSRYEYFLKGSKTMEKNHVESGKFTQDGQLFKYPELSIEDYKR